MKLLVNSLNFHLGLTVVAFLSANFGFAQAPVEPEKPSLEFSAYARAGFNTSLDFSSPSDSQGVSYIAHSRAVRGPSYYRLDLTKNLVDEAFFKFSLEGSGNFAAEREPPRENESFKVRNAYLQIPLSAEASIWAGARLYEETDGEDIRIFDTNVFGFNGYGVGGKFGPIQAALSFKDANPGNVDNNPMVKNKQLFLRYSYDLGNGISVRPTALITRYGAAVEQKVSADPASPPAQKIPGQTGFKAGVVVARNLEGYNAHTDLYVESAPKDISGRVKDHNLTIGVADSTLWEVSEKLGLLTGVMLENISYKYPQPKFKVESGDLVADGETKSLFKTSLGAQPVYYFTQNIHGAVDLNYAFTSQKVSQNDANAYFVTPILRYALNKNVLGTPQIYTSMTYGKYDWKAKKGSDGQLTDTLLTTQTGFEVWF